MKVECADNFVWWSYGQTGAFECTLDGWQDGPADVQIVFAGGIGLAGPCPDPSALAANPPVIRRLPGQAPAPFTVTVDTVRLAAPGGIVRIGTPIAKSEDWVTIQLADYDQTQPPHYCSFSPPA